MRKPLSNLLTLAIFTFFNPGLVLSDNYFDVDINELHSRLESNDFTLAQVNEYIPVHPLLPFTSVADLEPCSNFIDVEKEFKAAAECSDREIFSKGDYKTTASTLPIPKCYVITVRSPDVYHNEEDNFNFISLNNFFLAFQVVGLYDDNTIYIVENEDAPMVFRHEAQHYFLDKIVGDGNARHDHKIWDRCEPPYYIPSGKPKDIRNEKN